MKRLVVTGLVVLSACSAAGPVASPSSPSPTATPNLSPSPTPTLSGSVAPVPAVYVPVIGDWGAGTDAQRDIAKQMCEIRRTHPFTTVATTGDNFYPSGSATRATFQEPEACLLDAGVEWRATWGNHDVRGGTSTRTLLGAQRYYAWNLGGGLFLALDSNRPGDGAQRRFIERELSTSSAPVKIVHFHHPPYTAGLHPDDEGVKRHWMPLFEKYDVTLIISGHNHLYEHQLINGIDHIVSGGGGNTLHGCDRKPATLVRCVSQHHFLLLTIEPSRVRVEAITASGARLDSFWVEA